MKKEIEELIEKKAKKITEKYHFDTFDKYFKENDVNYLPKVRNILYKTLITPERKNILSKTYGFPFNFLFKSDSKLYFSPNFEEALIYHPPYFALYMFENSSPEEINDFCAGEQELKLYNIGFYPFYTINELSNLFKDFTTFMKNNNNSLLETGWPKYMYKKCFELLLHFAITCPVKIPKIIEDINKWECNNSLPFVWSKETFLDDRKKIIKCDYQHAPLLNTLSLKEVGFLEDIRPKIINLKKIILKEISDKLFSDRTNIDNWYKNCIKIIFDNISKGDLDKFLHINKKYNKIHIYDSVMFDDINGILSILRWVYQNIKFKFISSIKNTYRLILRGSIFDEQKDIISIYQWMQFASDPYESDRLDGIITEFINYQSKLEKRIELNNEFISDVLNSYQKEYLKIPLLIKSKYTDQVINFIKILEISKKLNMDIYPQEKIDRPPQKRITQLGLPPGTKWEHIVMQFIDNEKIRITAPNNFKYVTDYREMGFEDKRRFFPDTQWEFLYLLSNHINLSWENLAEMTHVKNIKDESNLIEQAKKKKQKIKERFMHFFQINEDPFYPYSKPDGYHPKFSILPQEHLQKYLQ